MNQVWKTTLRVELLNMNAHNINIQIIIIQLQMN